MNWDRWEDLDTRRSFMEKRMGPIMLEISPREFSVPNGEKIHYSVSIKLTVGRGYLFIGHGGRLTESVEYHDDIKIAQEAAEKGIINFIMDILKEV